jgi:hypothetical protein
VKKHGKIISNSSPVQMPAPVGTKQTDEQKSFEIADNATPEAISFEDAKVVARYLQPRAFSAYPLWQQHQLLNIAATHLEMGSTAASAWMKAMSKAQIDTDSAF